MNSKLGAAVAALVLAAAAGPAAAAIEAGEAASPIVRAGAPAPATKGAGVAEAPAMVMPAAGILRGDLTTPAPQGGHPGMTGDDVPTLDTLAPVPEPGKWAMILAGVLGVGAIARRRVSH